MTLEGRCESCGEVFDARDLSLAFQHSSKAFALLCSLCIFHVINRTEAAA